MTTDAILAAIDAEISKLQQARAMLAPSVADRPGKRSVGRPKGSKNTRFVEKAEKRVLSEEARSKIAAGQKKRWAAQKRAAL